MLSEERFVLVVASTQHVIPSVTAAAMQHDCVIVLNTEQLKKTYGATMGWMCPPLVTAGL
jgi:hypothetical protein